MNSKFVKNLSWIFAGNLAHAFLQFGMNILAARMLDPSAYGTINYSASLIAFFSSIVTLGFNYTVTKHYAENEEMSGEFTGSAIGSRVVAAIMSIILIQVVISFTDSNDPLIRIVVLLQSATILFGVFDSYVQWFRYKHSANVVATVRLIAFGLSAVFRLLVLLVSKDLVLYVVATGTESLLFACFLAFAYVRSNGPKLSFNLNTFKGMIKISAPFIFSALLTSIYGQTDKIMLKQLLNTESVAYYSVSLTLAGAISIIPIALIDGYRPEIMRNKIVDPEKYKRSFRQLYSIVFWLCICYGVFIAVFARHIIHIFYGDNYLPAAQSLATIVWYTSFSYFGAINNIYMVCENKSFWVQITTLVGAVTNVVLNSLLIPRWGVEGAAVASLITQIATNFAFLAFVPSLRPCLKLIIEGVTFRKTFNINKIRRKYHDFIHK